MLEERARWAMRIHDGLTQTVTSAVLELQTLRTRILADPAGAVASLSGVEAAIRADLREVRQMLFELYEDSASARAAARTFIDELLARWGLPARVTIVGDVDARAAGRPGDGARRARGIARERREARRNDRCRPCTWMPERRGCGSRSRTAVVGIRDADDGDPHFGLSMMRVRAEDIDGTLEIGSTPGGGTRVVALLPVGGRGEER